MKYSSFKELKISRFGLGTAQFGFDYGISNKTGRVSYHEIIKILEISLTKGVNFIDTARSYGVSEENIGRALEDLDAQNEFIVCTKLDLPPDYREKSEREVLAEAKESLSRSLEALKLDSIQVYLLHTPAYMTYGDGVIWDYLKDELKNGIIKHLGVSIAKGPSQALECMEDPAVEAIQIPYNVFDQRWREEGVLAHASDREIAVFNRSSYLQGLLLTTMKEAEERIPESLPYKKELNKTASEKGYELKDMVLRYVFDTKEIASTIIGTDSHEQFEENISIFEGRPMDEETFRQIHARFRQIPERVLNPGLWDIQFRP